MSEVDRDLSAKIMNALKPILPKGVGFIMICGSPKEGDLGITANLPDELALYFLEEAIGIIKSEPANNLEPLEPTEKEMN